MSAITKIVADIIEKEAARKRFDLGSGVVCTLKETKDGMGFEINLQGFFRSGNDIERTAKDIQNAWEKIDID
ncbi:MAG: hypothetical protein PHF86_02625 [Candidatus Nanoarchaeia archaeon]|jgi:hypothetical protein|nr:hypothetical protein [Candidatus Nanoarchaeia archaeon]